MPGIKTSAITYRRGISNSTPNFFLVAQANYVIPQPTSKFRQNNVTSVAPSPPPPPPPPTTPTTFTFTTSSGFAPITVSDSTITQISYLYRTNDLLSVEIGTSCTSIANNCFSSCSNLNSVTFLGNSVTNIGQYVFYQCSLSSITIPSSVTSLGNLCFAGNLFLQTVTFGGSNINSLPTGCFSDCQTLTSINIPNSVTQLGDNCLDQCYLLNDPNVLPVSVTSIGISCFQNCQALTSINLPPLLTSIPFNCFRNCSVLQSVNYLGSSITSFGELAFGECGSLQSIIIPNSVRTIGINCFLSCTALTSVTIGSSVEEIGANILYSCNSLTSLTFNNQNSITTDLPIGSSGILAFVNSTVVVTFDGVSSWSDLNAQVKNYFPQNPSSVTLPNYPATMSYNFVPIITTFTFTTGVLTTQSPNITNSMYINSGFLAADLIGVTIGTSCTSIGSDCFQNCNNFNFTTIVIPDSVISLGSQCFVNCEYINGTITIPNSVTSLGFLCFGGCQRIDEINFESGSIIDSLPNQCFFGCAQLALINIPQSVTSLGNLCFYNSGLTNITIPNSVLTLGNSCFSGCTNLTSLTFTDPSNIATNIPNGANGILGNINNTVVVTFNGASSWSGLNLQVTNYFPQNPSSVTLPNYPATMSYNFVPWSAFGTGLSDSAYALVKTSNALYVGGAFLTAGGVTVNNVAKWNGSVWAALGQGINGGFGSFGKNVYALAQDSIGNIYVGGDFSNVINTDGTPLFNTKRIAKWNGTAWQQLDIGVGFDNQPSQVNSIATSGTDVYVGGTFTYVTQGVSGSTNRIAKWDSNTGAWSALGFGANNAVNAIAVSGSDVYTGGTFSIVYTTSPLDGPGVSASRIAKWDTNTSSWSALGGGLDGSANAIAISGSDVYVGGTFTTAGGISANRIAKWNGTAWSALGNGLGGTVKAIDTSGNDVYVGGEFTATGDSVTVNYVAKWDTLTSSWSALPMSSLTPGTNNTVNALDINNSASELYLGGSFTTAGTVTVNRVASYII